jgi:hypothetical protein
LEVSPSEASARTPRKAESEETQIWRLSGTEVVVLAVLVAVSLGARLVALNSLEPNVNPDEADNITVAIRILAGNGPGIFGLGWDGNAALNIYVITYFLRILGPTIIGLRMASVIFSTVALVPFYLLARERLSAPASLAATLLFSTSLWYLNFSRNAWINVYIVLYTLAGAWLLSVALRRPRGYAFYASAGFFAALSLYGYFAGRAFVIALAMFLPLALWFYRRKWKTILAGFAVVLVVAGVLFLPQVPAMVDDWHFASLRTESVSVLDNPDTTVAGKEQIMWDQFQRMVRGYFLMDGSVIDAKPRYTPLYEPILDPLAGVLLVVGLAFSVFQLKRTAWWWLLLLVPLVSTQVFSSATPDPARAIGAVPVIYLFVGLALDKLVILRWGRHRAVIAALALVVAIAAAYNFTRYADWMNQPATALARQPAVENYEFDRWRDLQIARARAGEPSFNVDQWHQMR